MEQYHHMAEWLQSFYSSIDSRRSVLLLMDNFSAHISGVELAPPPPNIRIQWLPPNATSLYQPLDQGIISNLKHYYKKQWIKFMIEQYEQLLDPHKIISLAFTVRWITTAWFSNLKNETIYRCFRKVKIQPQQEPISLPAELLLNLTDLWIETQRAGNIQAAMSLENFLNPEGEDTPPQELEAELDLDEVIQHHIGQLGDVEQDEEEDQGEIQPVPSASAARAAVRLLLCFEERQETSTPSDIRYLERLERSINVLIASNLTQSSLRSWIM